MAATACQMTAVRVAHSYRAALQKRSVGRRASAASFGVRCGGFASLRAGGSRSRSCGVRFAVAEEAVAVEEEVPAESLAMYFKAEGSLNENAVSKVTKILEGTEGVSKVKVFVDEGSATVELVKQTSIQATGVASSLIEIIEEAGFKMQALSLGFDGDDDEEDDYIDYDASTYTEEEGEAAAAE